MTKTAALGLAVSLVAVSAMAQHHDHGAAPPSGAEHEHAPPASPPATAPPGPVTPAPPRETPPPASNSPADQLERFRKANPALGAKIDEFLRSINRDNPDSSEQAMTLALQIGGALDKIEKLKAQKAAGKIDKDQFKAMKAEALEGVSGALHGLMEADNSNGLAMRAVHRHFDEPLKGAGFDVSRHAKDMFGAHPGGFTGRYLAGVEQSAGNWPQAVEYAKQSLAYEPRNAQALGIVARGLFEQGDFAGANEAAQSALAIDRTDPVATSIARLTKGRSAPAQAAEEPMSAGAQAGPPRSGTAFFGSFQDRAVPTFSGPQAGAKEAAVLADKAHTYLRVGDKAAARAAAEKALALEPGQKRASLALSAVFMAQRDYVKALAALQDALKASGGRDSDLLTAQAGVLNRLGRYSEALASADLALKADPTKASALMNKAWALSGLGRREEALLVLRQAAQRDSRYRTFYERASALPADADLVPLFTGESGEKAAPKEVPGGNTFGWAAVAGGFLAGLLLIVLGVSQGGTLVTSITRGLSRIGSASPAVQPMPVGTPMPFDGLAAAGIRVDKKIGQGGMGVVFLGMDTSLERPVAIKKMREEIRSDIREKDRFIKEAKIVAALRHPNIVEVYSIVEDGADVYLVFEYVTGKTVHDLTQERGALPAGWAIAVVKAVASALDYAHKKGVVHRDLKPSNIMVEEEGMVKVMDFGVARMAKDSLSRMSMTNTVIGTPPYMAPEQEQGIVRRESDVYALGVCLFEMVTGTLPFQGIGAGMLMAKLNGTYVPASRIVQGLPPGFDEVMAMALAPDPDKRLKTAGDFAAALSALPV